MANRCTEGGNVHGQNVPAGPTYEVEVGDEIVTYQPMKCADCGQTTMLAITAIRKKPK